MSCCPFFSKRKRISTKWRPIPFPLRHYTRSLAYLPGYRTYSQNCCKREPQLTVQKAFGSSSCNSGSGYSRCQRLSTCGECTEQQLSDVWVVCLFQVSRKVILLKWLLWRHFSVKTHIREEASIRATFRISQAWISSAHSILAAARGNSTTASADNDIRLICSLEFILLTLCGREPKQDRLFSDWSCFDSRLPNSVK